MLGELRCASKLGGRFVELHRVGDELSRLPVDVGDLGDEPVGPHLGIATELDRVLDGSPLTFERAEPLDPVAVRLRSDHLVHDLGGGGRVLEQLLRRVPTLVVDHVLTLEVTAEVRPELRHLDHRQVEVAAVRGPHRAGPRVGPGLGGIPHRATGPGLAVRQRDVHRERIGPQADPEERDVEHRCLAGALAGEERGRDASGDRHPAQRVAVCGTGHPEHAVVLRRSHPRGVTTARPVRGRVVAPAGRLGSADAERAPAHVDDVRVHGAEVVEVDVQAGAGVREEVGQEDVALARQVVQQLERSGVLQRQADTALAPVRMFDDGMEVPVLPAAQSAHPPLRVTGEGVFHLHDVGAPVGEDRAGRRGEGELRDLEDADAFHRT